MELTYDWRRFQSVFQPHRKMANTPGTSSGPVYVVIEEQANLKSGVDLSNPEDRRIVAVFAENEDFSQWNGQSFQRLASEVIHRELVVFERAQVDQWVRESVGLSHFYDQTEYLRNSAVPLTVARGRFKRGSKSVALRPGARLRSERHFLLDALKSWWIKVSPSSFGIYVRLDPAGSAEEEQAIFLLIRRGSVELFTEPDVSSLGQERRKSPEAVVKYLSEKYLVPVQGLIAPYEAWCEWSEKDSPWRAVSSALRTRQARLVPRRMGVASLINARAFLGI